MVLADDLNELREWMADWTFDAGPDSYDVQLLQRVVAQIEADDALFMRCLDWIRDHSEYLDDDRINSASSAK